MFACTTRMSGLAMTYCLEQNDVLKSLSVTITETVVADMMHKTSPTMNCTAMPDDVFGLLGAPRDHTAAVFLCRGSFDGLSLRRALISHTNTSVVQSVPARDSCTNPRHAVHSDMIRAIVPYG